MHLRRVTRRHLRELSTQQRHCARSKQPGKRRRRRAPIGGAPRATLGALRWRLLAWGLGRARDNPLERAVDCIGTFIGLDLASGLDETLELLGVVGLWLGLAGHAPMVARCVGKSFLESHLSALAGVAQLADGDVSCPPIDPVNDARSRADLPAKRNQDSDSHQGTCDYDGKSSSHRFGTIILGDDPILVAALNVLCEDLRDRRCTESTPGGPGCSSSRAGSSATFRPGCWFPGGPAHSNTACGWPSMKIKSDSQVYRVTPRSKKCVTRYKPCSGSGLLSGIEFAPGLVGTFQDSEGGDGRHGSSPSSNGSLSWRGSHGPCRRPPRPSLEREFFFVRPSATSCLVGQPFASRALNRAISAFGILDAEGGSVAIAEIEFRQISVQVVFGNVKITAGDSTLEDRKEAFDGVGVRLGAIVELARPFFLTVIHGIVSGKLTTDAAIGAEFVSHQPALGVCGLEHDASESCRSDVLDLMRTGLPAALDERNDWDAIGTRALFLPAVFRMQYPSRAAFLVDGIGLVKLNDLAFAAERTRRAFVHREPYAMSQKPCRFQATAERPVQLAGREPLLAAANQVDRLKPDVQRNVRTTQKSIASAP